MQQFFDHRGERDDQDWEALLELRRWAHRTEAGPDWAAGLEERFDVDASSMSSPSCRVFDNRGEPWTGRVSLYYENRPGATWLPALELAGRAFAVGDEGRSEWLPTDVNPFANAATAELTIEGTSHVRLLFRR